MKLVVFFMSLVLVLVTARELRCYRVVSYGTCNGRRQMWAFSHYDNKCVKFFYSGCGGTDNRFWTKESCEFSCKIM